jgi:hypothetical protein
MLVQAPREEAIKPQRMSSGSKIGDAWPAPRFGYPPPATIARATGKAVPGCRDGALEREHVPSAGMVAPSARRGNT